MEPNNIFDTFFSIQNPAIIVLVLFAVISVVVFFIKKDFIKPLEKKSGKLEDENLRLMALFAELDPDPILRVDENGIIIKMNDPAKDFFPNGNIINQRCDKLIPNYEELKKNSHDNNQEVSINGKHYTVSIRVSKHLNFTQIYLHDITHRIEQERIIKEYQENLKLLRIKFDDINEKEREKIGSELHDHIGNRISILKLNLQNYIEKPDDKGPEELYRKIDFLSKEVREISHQLSPKMLKEFGLISALTALVDDLTKNSQMNGHIINVNYEEINNFKLKLTIFRIIQEALNNIIKHSGCSEFQIQLVIEDNYLKVIVNDNGIGCSIEKLKIKGKQTLGLFNMKERTESLNGKFEFVSAEGKGTTIFLEFYLGDSHDKGIAG